MRNIPFICLVIALIQLLSSKLKLKKHFIAQSVKFDDGQSFMIFRHITRQPLNESSAHIVFIVRFKFARLSHMANKIASIIPMLIIAGFRGFMAKLYAVNTENGYWLGMYQWRSQQDLDAYQKSFVFQMMKKRAVKGSVTFVTFSNLSLNNYIQEQSEKPIS